MRNRFKLRVVCLSSIFILTSAFADVGGVARDARMDEIDVDTGVIFSARLGELDGLCERSIGCWTPTPADIAALEKVLPGYLHQSKERSAIDISMRLTRYKRKYFGITRGGARWILVNGLCEKYWRRTGRTFQTTKRPMTDMGACYFSVEYDVKRKRFADFYIDGNG